MTVVNVYQFIQRYTKVFGEMFKCFPLRFYETGYGRNINNVEMGNNTVFSILSSMAALLLLSRPVLYPLALSVSTMSSIG